MDLRAGSTGSAAPRRGASIGGELSRRRRSYFCFLILFLFGAVGASLIVFCIWGYGGEAPVGASERSEGGADPRGGGCRGEAPNSLPFGIGYGSQRWP